MKEQKKWGYWAGGRLGGWAMERMAEARFQKYLWLALRFGGGLILSRAIIFETYAPFGIGWLAAAGGGVAGLAALLGGILGYMSQGLYIDSLKYIAILVLVYAGAMIFRSAGLTKHTVFVPLIAGVVTAFIGFVFVADAGFQPAAMLLYITEILLVGGSGYFYGLALPRANGDAPDTGSPGQTRHTVSLLLLYATLLLSLSGFSLLGGITPARLAAGLYVLYTAYRQGAGMGSAAGLTAGCAMDLALGYPYFSMSYGAAGLLSGVFKNTGKFVTAVVFVLAGAIAALWAGAGAFRMTVLMETFVISVLFMLIPVRAVAAGRTETDEEAPQKKKALRRTYEGDRVREHTRQQLEQSAIAFRELHAMLVSVFDRQKNDEDVSTVFTQATNTHCRRCALRALCWEQDAAATRRALDVAAGALSRDGCVTPVAFPGLFTSRCIQLPQFVKTVNEEMTALLSRRQYRARLRESRTQICHQTAEVAKIFSGLAEELSDNLIFDEEAELRITGLLTPRHAAAQVTVAERPGGAKFVELYGPGVGALLDGPREKLLDGISISVGYPVAMPEQVCAPDYEKLIFPEAETLRASIGIAAHQKHGHTENGDSGAWFKTSDGKVFLILSDGMGAGHAAGEESARAVRLLERFLRAGIDPGIALSTLNSALVFRGDATTEGFVTVDLCVCNLMSGQTRLYKNGASPSYIKRGSRVSRVSGQSWPAGLGQITSPGSDVTTLRLDAGDLCIMVSDGACETGEDPWLSQIAENFDGKSPRELARKILTEAIRRNGQEDDMMVLVLSLDQRVR